MVSEDKLASLYGTDTATPFRIPGLDLVNPPSPEPEKPVEVDNEEEYEPPEDIFAELQRAIDAPSVPTVLPPTPQPPLLASDGEADSSSSDEGGVRLSKEQQRAANITTQNAIVTDQPQVLASDRAQTATFVGQTASWQQPTLGSYGFFQPCYSSFPSNAPPQYDPNRARAFPFAAATGQMSFGPFGRPTGSVAPPQWALQHNRWTQLGTQNAVNAQAFAQPNGWQANQQRHIHEQAGARQRGFNTYSAQTRYSLRSSGGRQARPAYMDTQHLQDAAADTRNTPTATAPSVSASVQATISAPAPGMPRNRRRERPTLDLIPRPNPTETYLWNATRPKYRRLQSPKKLLIITDLNGTLLYRPNPTANPKRCLARPNLFKFLQYLFTNHAVMVWSSAKAPNVNAMVDAVFTKDQQKMMVTKWARETLRLSAQHYNQRVQVYKQLSWVWKDGTIVAANARMGVGEPWDQTNTVLLDDSVKKAAAEPHNLVEIPEWIGAQDDDVLNQVVGYFEELKYAANASQFMAKNPFKLDHRWSYVWP